MAGKKQLEDRQTIITLKNGGLSYREIAKKVKVSEFPSTSKRKSETGANSEGKRSGRPKDTTESLDKFRELTACVVGSSQANSFKHCLIIVVVVSKSLFQL